MVRIISVPSEGGDDANRRLGRRFCRGIARTGVGYFWSCGSSSLRSIFISSTFVSEPRAFGITALTVIGLLVIARSVTEEARIKRLFRGLDGRLYNLHFGKVRLPDNESAFVVYIEPE
jgi:hypothetical protein